MRCFFEKSKPSNFFIYKGFNKAYDKTQGVYDKIVKWLLQRPGMALVSYGALTVIAVLLFMHWPSTFIPDEDDGYFIAVVQLPPAASLERTQAVGDKVNAILDSYPEVKNYIGISGFSIMGGGEQSNSATYFVVLKNWDERKGKEHTAAAVVNRFNGEAYMTIQAARYLRWFLRLFRDWVLPAVCNFSWKTGETWADGNATSYQCVACFLSF